jgi:hypothetical protein
LDTPETGTASCGAGFVRVGNLEAAH